MYSIFTRKIGGSLGGGNREVAFQGQQAFADMVIHHGIDTYYYATEKEYFIEFAEFDTDVVDIYDYEWLEAHLYENIPARFNVKIESVHEIEAALELIDERMLPDNDTLQSQS